MDFRLTDEQIQVRDMVREFAASEVAPYIQEWEAKGEFHPEVLQKMGELGILGLPIPERYGGGGHPRVGAISFERGEVARAREVAAGIVAELSQGE